MSNPTPDSARAFARDWIAAWNARDLDAVLAHCSEDCTFASPFVAGKARLRARMRTGYASGASAGAGSIMRTTRDGLGD